jgi:hypothetical protein
MTMMQRCIMPFGKANDPDATLHHSHPESRRAWCNAAVSLLESRRRRCTVASCLAAKQTDMLQRCITAFRKTNGHDATIQHARSESEKEFRNGAEGLSGIGFGVRKRWF